MLAPVKHISALTLIQRERILPVPGRVIARQGQAVSPTDVVAEYIPAPKHVILDIAEGLNVSPDRANKLLQHHKGDNVSKGDVIAGPAGLFQRVVRAPFPGRIKLAGDGKVLIEAFVSPTGLQAGLDGTVTKIIPGWGVIVETRGALVQGVWGNGKIAYGLMQLILKSPDDELTANKIDISNRGAIVVGGHCQSLEVFQHAARIPLKGIILGSMSAALITAASKAPFPVVVLDGFGQYPMNSAAYKLLTTTTKDRNISLHAQAYQASKGERPEIVITLPAPDHLEALLGSDEFALEQKVYIVSKPYAAQIGIIKRLLPKPFKFPNGIVAPAAEVSLENNELVKVPLASLESFGEKTSQDTY